MAEGGSGGNNDRLGAQVASVGGHHLVVAVQRHAGSLGHDKLGSGVHGLFLGSGSQLGSGDSLGKAGEVFDFLQVDNLGAAHHLLDHRGAEAVARSIYGGGQPCQPAADH